MNAADLVGPDGVITLALIPVIACIVLGVAIAAGLRVVGRRLLDDAAQADGLARTALVGIISVGVLLGLGRLADREATDSGLRASLTGIIGALPSLTILFIVLIMGLLVAAILRATVVRAVGGIRPALARIAGAVCYWVVVGLVVLIAAEQAGIDVGIIQEILLLFLTGLVAAIAIGLGLGLRPLVGAVIAGRHVEGFVRPGQDIQIGDVAGTVLAVGHVSVSLRTATGDIVDVPHSTFLELPTEVGNVTVDEVS